MSAVVFDCDGVLVDSEPLSELAWAEVLAPYGYTPAADDFRATRGLTSPDTYRHFAMRTELPGPAEVVAAVDAVRRREYDRGLDVFEDAVSAVRELALVGTPLAVASSSSRTSLEHKLDLAGLARFFEVVVSGSDVARGKPAPDLYLAAARRLDVDPGRCLAVEDAVAGADAAAAAGMRVVMVDRGVGTVDARYAITSRLEADLLLLWLG